MQKPRLNEKLPYCFERYDYLYEVETRCGRAAKDVLQFMKLFTQTRGWLEGNRQLLSDTSGYSIAHVNRGMQELSKLNLVKKSGSRYFINPEYVWSGDGKQKATWEWEKRFETTMPNWEGLNEGK